MCLVFCRNLPVYIEGLPIRVRGKVRVEVHYKIQAYVSKEFTPKIDWLGHPKYVQIKQKISFLWNSSVALNYRFPSQCQWSILPIFVDWSQDGLELENKNELIAGCKGKQMVPTWKWLFPIYFVTARGLLVLCTVGHKFWPESGFTNFRF